jgi:two-component system cell cycle sensor histidine kinase/response regulator CckA
VVVALRNMMTTGVDHPPGEISLMRKDGSRVTVFSSHVALRLPGLDAEFFCLDMDLTELNRLAQERMDMERKMLHAQKLESLGVLAGGIAHDFNNLLTAMLGNLDLVLRDVSPVSPAYTSLHDALTAVNRAADLTRQMLAYAGKSQFVLQEINLNRLVEENFHILRTAICKTASLKLNLSPSLPAIRGDLGQLQQVVMNLITNASDALENRPGAIALVTRVAELTTEQLCHSRSEAAASPGRFVVLEVTDDGCGMDESTLNRLFDPFFTTKRSGRGLGLSALLGIIRNHDGVILVDSKPGLGTCFRVAFPALAIAAPSRPATEALAVTLSRTSLAGMHILLVDDEAGIRLFGQRSLIRMGARVVVAENGVEALALAQEHAGTLSCALVDLTMPQMDGLSCLRALKQSYPGLPVILSSGYARDEVARRLKGHTLDGFISKPYVTETLALELIRVVGPAPSAGG